MGSGSLVIPGVEVSVVKEVVAPQLSPSGILGIVGITERAPPVQPMQPVQSYSRFLELYGAGSAHSMPEASLALANGVAELVVSPIAATPAIAVISCKNGNASSAFTLTARAPGSWGNELTAVVTSRKTLHNGDVIDLEIKRGQDPPEVLRNLKPPKDGTSVASWGAVPADGTGIAPDISRFVTLSWKTGESPQPNGPEVHLDGPRAVAPFHGGTDPCADAYEKAIGRLEEHAEVDMVLAALLDMRDQEKVARVYDYVIRHCKKMSEKGQGRIGFGQVSSAKAAAAFVAAAKAKVAREAAEKAQASGATADDVKAAEAADADSKAAEDAANAAAADPAAADIDAWSKLANNLRSDRFVLLAPWGTAGAVAGMVGSLDYFQSPTFKMVAGLTALSRKLLVEEQERLLKQNVVPVANMRDLGTIVMHGLTTDGDQISVRRVADRAVRGVKLIGNRFIGRLNNETGRDALKQKLAEFLVQMERDGAIVPSTDGEQPAFALRVESTQPDFAKGIVRVDLKVRPVRAIDYIYATVLVQT
jgi:hypothetical protein